MSQFLQQLVKQLHIISAGLHHFAAISAGLEVRL